MNRIIASKILLPVFAGAALLFPSLPAAAANDNWGLPHDGNVTRGQFIRAAVHAMEISVQQNAQPSGEYLRVAPGYAPFIAAVEKKNDQALDLLGSDLQLGRFVNRVDAVHILVALQRNLKTGVSDPYRDVVDGSETADAVMHAVNKGWIKPLRPEVFGGNRLLVANEALDLIKYASGNMPLRPVQQQDSGDDVPTIRIEFKGTGSKSATQNVPNQEVLETVWQLIRSDYLYQDRVKEQEAMQKGIAEMVKSLDDPYSAYLTPAAAQQFQTQIDGEVSGIGAQVEDRGGMLTIVTPLPGSPAQKSGLKPNDVIIKVDGESIVDLGFMDAVNKVRGPRGSSIVLTIRRDGQEFNVTVQRDTVKVPEIDVSWQGSVAIVKIMQFGRLTDSELYGIMQEIAEQKPTGIVLDLRNNPGGLLHAANSVLSNFLPKGSDVAIIRSRKGEATDHTEKEPTISADVPLMVLVNEGSASASEIVAGALQDHGRGKLIGTKTFGKGTVQEVLEFIDRSSLKLTIAEWFTPKGRKIDGLGLQPDLKVEYSEDRDAQLLRALELLPGALR